MRPSQTESTGQLRKCTLILLAVVLVGAIGVQVDAAKKMKPEQLVALHLESIGTAEAREQVDSIVILGEAAVIPKVGGSGRIEGTSRLISTGAMSLIEMKFQNVNYPHERLIFDGEKVGAGDCAAQRNLRCAGRTDDLESSIAHVRVIMRLSLYQASHQQGDEADYRTDLDNENGTAACGL